MTPQQIFNRVVQHLHRQGKKAMDPLYPVACAYRGEPGTSCAVGCLIKDEFYSEQIEGKPATNFMVVEALVYSGVLDSEGAQPLSRELQLLKRLQGIHDAVDLDKWEERLIEAGHDFKLTWPDPET